MDDREAALRELAEDLVERDAVGDAWLAKSFTDRLFVVDLLADEELPASLREELLAAGLQPYNDLHDVPALDAALPVICRTRVGTGSLTSNPEDPSSLTWSSRTDSCQLLLPPLSPREGLEGAGRSTGPRRRKHRNERSE